MYLTTAFNNLQIGSFGQRRNLSAILKNKIKKKLRSRNLFTQLAPEGTRIDWKLLFYISHGTLRKTVHCNLPGSNI